MQMRYLIHKQSKHEMWQNLQTDKSIRQKEVFSLFFIWVRADVQLTFERGECDWWYFYSCPLYTSYVGLLLGQQSDANVQREKMQYFHIKTANFTA